MRTTALLGLSLSIPLANCSAPPDPATIETGVEELRSLPPFAIQFAGTYRNPAPGAGRIEVFTFDRNGRYSAYVTGRSAPETGGVRVTPQTALPLTFQLQIGCERWTATVRAYDALLYVERDGVSTTLRADGIVGPNETLCDASGGAWTDDDPDPRTGLYCICPLRETYIPSLGGCGP